MNDNLCVERIFFLIDKEYSSDTATVIYFGLFCLVWLKSRFVNRKKNEEKMSTLDTEKDEDQSWVLDSLVGFLKSPLWSTSLNDFIDRHSISK